MLAPCVHGLWQEIDLPVETLSQCVEEAGSDAR